MFERSQRLVCVGVLLSLAWSQGDAQTLEGSLADELGISANGGAAQAVFSGSAGVGIPLPNIALGIAPGEPTLLVNTDLNIVAIAGGAIEDATGGVVPSGAAQSVIRTGLSGGDVVAVIENQAARIVAQAVEEQSGGFIPASAARAVVQTAINGGDVRDALESAVTNIVIDEATRLIGGRVGRAVQDLSNGLVDAATVERLFNGALSGQNLGPLFRQALQQRLGSLRQGNANQNPVLIVNVAAGQRP